MGQDLSTILSSLAALGSVLALVLLAGRAARLTRFARGSYRPPAAQRLSLQDTLALDRNRRLSLVRCDGREVLVLTGGGADVVLGWLPEGAP